MFFVFSLSLSKKLFYLFLSSPIKKILKDTYLTLSTYFVLFATEFT